MKRVRAILVLCALILGFLPASVLAQSPQNFAVNEESISSFNSVVAVNLDNSVSVEETIVYNTGALQRHGIYRDIRPVSSEGRAMDITNINVTDSNGSSVTWVRQSAGGNVRIRIGDANVTFQGQRTYIISYRATQAVAHLKDADEIYWNVTGNEWKIPIYQSKARVILPQGVSVLRSACYVGASGSKDTCARVEFDGDPQAFATQNSLAPGQGLTVAVGFPAGILPAYSTLDNISSNFYRYIAWLAIILIPLITFIVMFRKWWRIGRDPKGTGVIVPQYDVPNGLTPLEVAGIVNQRVTAQDIPAEIIYLATKGYIKIKYISDKLLGFIKTTDYELVLVKAGSDISNEFDIKLLQHLFIYSLEAGNKVKMSDLKNSFYAHIPSIVNSVIDALLLKKYYSNFAKKSFSGIRIGINIIVIAAWVAIFVGGMLNEVTSVSIWYFALSIVSSVIIWRIFQSIMPAKTKEGVAAREYLLGLKDYLQIAEKDRLAFHNAPAKKPEIFEKLLPYAMVFGVANAWSKEFEDIYVTPPGWYEGYTPGSAFNSVIFYNSLSNFSSAARTNLSSSPGGGGSGGGGFSGGGGGGGGGGGW
ncbi:MAG: hypothetical protein RL536_331 [Candidatus Parcubacteria bacterium]|jgi:uncharacterized membrane protein